MSEPISNCKVMDAFGDSNGLYEIAALSEIGDREEQQDCFGCSLSEEAVLFVVCDGMGGHEGGKLASILTAKEIITNYNSNLGAELTSDFLVENFKEIDKKVAELKNAEGERINCGSTAVALLIRGRSLFWCSVGDSRAYLLRKGEFVQLTRDQNYRTVLEERLNAGVITREEYEGELGKGGALISYMGIGDLSLIDYSTAPIELYSGDKIVIATDGLYRLVGEEDIKSITDNFHQPDDAARALELTARRKAAKLKQARDNSTIAIIKIK